MTEELFEVRNISAGYGKLPVVTGVSFSLDKGEILTLAGPNGSGKSTIIKAVTGSLPLKEGQVLFGGCDLTKMKRQERAQRIAVVLTERIRPERMTCFDAVAAGRYPYTGALGLLSEQDRQIVRRVLGLVQLEDLADRDLSETSDGQKQLLYLARAIAQSPQLIVLDEPTSFLDIRYKLMFLDILKTLAEEKGVSVIMSLHEMELARKISDRIVCVKAGQVEAEGTPEDVLTDACIRRLFSVPEDLYETYLGPADGH